MNKIKAIDFFCGCGGMTHGLRLSGIDVFAGMDIDKSCKESYEYNNQSKFIHQDISRTTAKEIKQLFKVQTNNAEYSLIAGCAPCQPYSAINSRKKDNDQRKTLIDEFSRIIRGVKPHFVLMENVSRLTEENQYFSSFIKSLKSAGYSYQYKVLNAKDYSVAQSRKRLFLIATRLKKTTLSFDGIKKKPLVTLKDVIYNLEPITHNAPSRKDKLHRSKILNNLNLKRMLATPKNGGLRSSWTKDLISPCHREKSVFLDNYGRLSWDKLSSTVTTKFNQYYSGRFGHPDQNRALSLREGALIQSFPKKYKFFGSDTEIARQIGNAVPVNLSMSVGYLFVNSL
jgi:DNA (cytosine-5)-methyltransferase 1